MDIDHIGYAVRDISKSILAFGSLGFVFGGIIEDRDRNILLCFGEKNGYRIELVSPAGGGKSPVDNVLKRNGDTPYHFCYTSADLEEDIDQLEQKGFRVILPAAKAAAFGGKRVVFMIHPAVGLIELAEGT